MKIFFRNYTEVGAKVPSVRLTDEEYAKALERFIAVCTDVAVIDRQNKTMYLAERIAKPGKGLWMIGGGMLPGLRVEEAASIAFKRETGVEIAEDRLTIAGIVDYQWKDRAQEPQDVGCHVLGYILLVELTQSELSGITLDPKEYHAESSLKPYTREQLVSANVNEVLINVFDTIFDTSL